MSDEFYRTLMGRRFYEGTMVKLVNNVEEMATHGIHVHGLEEATAAINRLANALEALAGDAGKVPDKVPVETELNYPLMVAVPNGTLIAAKSGGDIDHPGIAIGFIPDGNTAPMNVCVVEYPAVVDIEQEPRIL